MGPERFRYPQISDILSLKHPRSILPKGRMLLGKEHCLLSSSLTNSLAARLTKPPSPRPWGKGAVMGNELLAQRLTDWEEIKNLRAKILGDLEGIS